MADFSEEIMKRYREECDKAKSNLEAPLIGVVTAPICKSCKFSDFKSDPWHPKCEKYGKMPQQYRSAEKFDCPEYQVLDNCPMSFLPLHIQRKLKEN